jgi:hypothetical protein
MAFPRTDEAYRNGDSTLAQAIRVSMQSNKTQTLKVSGIVRDMAGKRLLHQPVSLTVNGVRYRTVTNGRGVYRFFGIPNGTGELKLNNVTRAIKVGAAPCVRT